jgi:methyl-accepting chemotaxis protein
MRKNWTFGRRLAAGFAVAGLTLLVTGVEAYRTTYGLLENERLVSHTYEVRIALADLISGLVNAETGQRGYIITQSESYLAPYQTALRQIKGTFANLQRLTADDPIQQRRLLAMSPLIDSKLAELKQTIELRKNQGFDAAVKVVVTNAGKIFMDQLRALDGEADQAEAVLLEQRVAEAKSSAEWTMAIILWGSLTGVIFVVGIGWFITGSLSRQIGTSVGQVRSSSAELQSAANQQATGSREQATAMGEITATTSELLATSRQIAEIAQRVAHIADQTASAARSGHGTVDTTHESIIGIRHQVDQIVAHMLELGRKSQEIGTVLEIVSELAEQTNILAINATIEAAGAGEAGKRFAVVADEIRKLADRVGSSAKEIRTLIDDVRSAVNTTVMATETGSKAVDSGSRSFAEVADLFRKISGLVSATTEAAKEIELSTKQQTTAVEQVNGAIGSVAQASKETETSAGQTLQTAAQLAGLSSDLLRMVRPQKTAVL